SLLDKFGQVLESASPSLRSAACFSAVARTSPRQSICLLTRRCKLPQCRCWYRLRGHARCNHTSNPRIAPTLHRDGPSFSEVASFSGRSENALLKWVCTRATLCASCQTQTKNEPIPPSGSGC